MLQDNVDEPCRLHLIPQGQERYRQLQREWEKGKPKKKKIPFSTQLGIAKAVASGMRYQQVAEKFGCSISTVKAYKDTREG